MFTVNGEWSCDHKNDVNVHCKKMTVRVILDHRKSPLTGVLYITERVYVSSKLSDCIIYSFIYTLDYDTLYSRNKLKMDMMVLCDHNSSSDLRCLG